MSKVIWITWENQRRNRELSQALNARLFELKEIDRIKNPVRKYFFALFKTMCILVKERPIRVFCQNPSIVLSTFMVTLAKIIPLRVIVDAHNAGLFPLEGRSDFLKTLSWYVIRRATLNIVTNQGLSDYVKLNGGKAFILQDKVPSIPLTPLKKLVGKFNLLFICSYGADEPYNDVFKAAETIDPSIHIYVTGNYEKKNVDPLKLPENVTLLGYIPENEYAQMLNSVDATIDLTTREDCLVCGAYETIAVEKPQILSDKKALRSYFSKGVVYSDNTPQSIVDSIHSIIANQEQLKQEARQLKKQLTIEWNERKKMLEVHLAELERPF